MRGNARKQALPHLMSDVHSLHLMITVASFLQKLFVYLIDNMPETSVKFQEEPGTVAMSAPSRLLA